MPKKGKRNKRYLWSNALHVRFLIAMVDWAEKNAKLTDLHGYMGEIGKKCVTKEELKAHKEIAARFNAPVRAEYVQQLNTQIESDYDNPEKMHKPLPNSAAPVCFTDFPVCARLPPPVPALVKTVSSNKRRATAAPQKTKKKKSKQTSTSTTSTSTSTSTSTTCSSSDNKAADVAAHLYASSSSTTSTTPTHPSSRRGSQDHEAAKQLFDFLVPGSNHDLPNQYHADESSMMYQRRRSSIKYVYFLNSNIR